MMEHNQPNDAMQTKPRPDANKTEAAAMTLDDGAVRELCLLEYEGQTMEIECWRVPLVVLTLPHPKNEKVRS